MSCPHIYTLTQTQSCTQTHSNTKAHMPSVHRHITHKGAHTDIQRHTGIQIITHTHKEMLTWALTQAHTFMYTDTHSYTQPHTLMGTHSCSYTQAHAHRDICSHRDAHTHVHTLSHTGPQSHAPHTASLPNTQYLCCICVPFSTLCLCLP